MKHFIFLLLILISFDPLFSQTNGKLNIHVTTSETGGFFAPRNIVAIWIEDSDGNFIKTLLVYANYQKTHLNTWQTSTENAGAQYNDVDAITGVTRTSHGNRECLWNGLDYNQNLMPDGTYKICMELTDKNETGNYSYFEFVKSESPQSLNPSNVASFANIGISWEPGGVGIIENQISNQYNVSNNPGYGKFEITEGSFDRVEVFSISGEFIGSFESSIIDIQNQANGVYLFKIHKSDKLSIKKVLKR